MTIHRTSAMLYKPVHRPLILSRRKKQTRRNWKTGRVKVGGLSYCFNRPAWAVPPGLPFADTEILKVWREPLGDISEADAFDEGYDTRQEFHTAFQTINKLSAVELLEHLNELVWCVKFDLIEIMADEAA